MLMPINLMTPSPSKPVGLIGLGLVGSAFSERLLARQLSVLGWDIGAAQRDTFATLGGTLLASVSEVFDRCERVILSLPSHREVGDVIDLAAFALRPGHIIIDTTTGDPASTAALAVELAARGVTYLDATISGSSAQVRSGAAIMMVGGDAAAYAACTDLFALLVSAAFHTGPAGTGAKMKLVTNLVLGLNRAVLAEGLAFAEALNLDPELTLAIMRRSPAYSRAMDVKGEKMIRNDFSPEARLSQHLKDVRLIVEGGTDAGLPMPFSLTHREVLEAAETAGLGGLDNSALIQVLRARVAKESSV
ncbi:MAG: NAD(P)-dependent oxidoreductase [Verrucomicrobiota bacterium]